MMACLVSGNIRHVVLAGIGKKFDMVTTVTGGERSKTE